MQLSWLLLLLTLLCPVTTQQQILDHFRSSNKVSGQVRRTPPSVFGVMLSLPLFRVSSAVAFPFVATKLLVETSENAALVEHIVKNGNAPRDIGTRAQTLAIEIDLRNRGFREMLVWCACSHRRGV